MTATQEARKAASKNGKPKNKEEKKLSIICPTCGKENISGSVARTLKEVMIMLSYPPNLLKREYHQNRIGQLFFECCHLACGMPIYLKGIQVDIGDKK